MMNKTAKPWINAAGFILVWVTLLILSLLRGGTIFWFMTIGIGVILLMIAVFPARSLRSIQVNQPSIQTVNLKSGGDGEVAMRVEFCALLPLPWLTIRIMGTREPGDGECVKAITVYPWFRSSVSCRFLFPAMERGVYRFAKVTCTTGDIFGFRQVSRNCPFPAPVTVYVLPSPLTLIKHVIHLTEEEGTPIQGPYQIQPDAVQSVNAALRPYAIGDHPGQIHWRTSARRGSLYVKEMEAELADSVLIAMDAGVNDDHPNGEFLFERRIEATAGLLKYAKQNGWPSHLAANTIPPIAVFPSHAANPELLLASAGQGAAETFISVIIEHAVRMSVHAPIAIVTSTVSPAFMRGVEILREENRMITVYYVHTDEEKDVAEASWLHNGGEALQRLGVNMIPLSCVHDGEVRGNG